VKKMKINFKRCISTIAVLSMIATIVSGFSMTASASGESVLVTLQGEDWAEVYNKKLIDVMTPDGPISPEWNMETSYGTWEANPETVKESFDVIDNNLVFGKENGDTQLVATLTDSMLNGDFIIDVKCAMLGKLTSGTNNYWPLEFRFDGHCFASNPTKTGHPLRFCFAPSCIYMSMGNMDYVNRYDPYPYTTYPNGVSPTEKSDAPYNYCYLRLVVNNSMQYHKIRPYIKLNEEDDWTFINRDDWTVANLKLLDTNNQIKIRVYDSRTIVDSVKIYKKVSDIDDDYIVNDIAIEKKSEFEYTTKVNLANIRADMPVKICTQIYEIDGANENCIDEIVDEYTGVIGQADTYKQNFTVPQDGKAYMFKVYVMYKDDIIKSIEYGDVSVLSSNITSNGKTMLGGAVSMIGDSSVFFKNKETQEEIEGECLIEGNDAFLISKASLDEGVEYEIIVRGKSGTQSKTIDFAGSNVVKVLYNVDAKLTKSENSVNYELDNRLNEAATAEIFIVKYKGLKLCSLEHETISLMANEKKQGEKTVILESGETATVFILNDLSDYVLISDAITLE